MVNYTWISAYEALGEHITSEAFQGLSKKTLRLDVPLLGCQFLPTFRGLLGAYIGALLGFYCSVVRWYFCKLACVSPARCALLLEAARKWSLHPFHVSYHQYYG